MAKILTIIPYSFYPPQNGGSLRCFYILREMSREQEVYLFTVQPVADFYGAIEPIFPSNVTVISLFDAPAYKSIFNLLPDKLANAINYRLLKKSFRAITNSYFLKAYPLLTKTFKEVKPDIVYYENLESVGLFSALVKKQLPSAKQIYDAHNVDSVLWSQMAMVQNNSMLNEYAVHALETEKKLFKMVDGVFCCSEHDKVKLMQLNKGKLKAWMIPNGVDTEAKAFDPNLAKQLNSVILFCGSLDYYPNEEGLLWFYDQVFSLVKKAVPNVILTLVGSCQIKESYQKLLNDSSVKFEGRVVDVQPFYNRASVCIAPLLSGSGTRLKILEAMSFGNPVVSTAIGAEGIDVVPGKHILLANEPQDFADNIIRILQSNILFDQIRNAAHDLVQTKYDWAKIGVEIINIIEQVLEVQLTEDDR